jgi:hypothetical protein
VSVSGFVGETAMNRSKYTAPNRQARECYFCDEVAEAALVDHHVIPGRYDNDTYYSLDLHEETVTLCATCHAKAHSLIDPCAKWVAKITQERCEPDELYNTFTKATELSID